MHRKLFSLAPLLAVVAFAVMPAASRAANPHWYKSGTRLAEGSKLPIVEFGGAVNLAQESPAGEINCKGVGAGYVENPKGTAPNTGEKGPAGVGKTESSNFYECKEPKCEAEIAASPLGGLGFKGVGFAVAYNLPWNNELLNTAEPFEERIGAKPSLNFGQGFAEGYPAKQQAPSGTGSAWGAAGAVGAIIGCEISPNPEGTTGPGTRVAAQLPFEGELHPSIGGALNEQGSAGKPAKTEFLGKASGELEDPLGAGNGGSQTGQIKYLGYTTQNGVSVLGG